ncbi:SHOCT domain-containing protein [bacterium]|nr:SHOCT domain-containing protein [bacterium]
MPPSVSPSESNSKPMVFNDAQIALINKFTRISEKENELAWEKYRTKQDIAQSSLFLGIFIAAISAISLIYFKYVAVAYAKRTYANKKLKAENELLKDRELYDKGILTKEEFEKKVAEGKKHII